MHTANATQFHCNAILCSQSLSRHQLSSLTRSAGSVRIFAAFTISFWSFINHSEFKCKHLSSATMAYPHLHAFYVAGPKLREWSRRQTRNEDAFVEQLYAPKIQWNMMWGWYNGRDGLTGSVRHVPRRVHIRFDLCRCRPKSLSKFKPVYE